MQMPVFVRSAFSEWALDFGKVQMSKETRVWRCSPGMRQSLRKTYLGTAGFGLVLAVPGLWVFGNQNFLLLAQAAMWKQFWFAVAGLTVSLMAFAGFFAWPLLLALREKTVISAEPGRIRVGAKVFSASEGAIVVFSKNYSPAPTGRTGSLMGNMQIADSKRTQSVAVVSGGAIQQLADFASKLSLAAGVRFSYDDKTK